MGRKPATKRGLPPSVVLELLEAEDISRLRSGISSPNVFLCYAVKIEQRGRSHISRTTCACFLTPVFRSCTWFPRRSLLLFCLFVLLPGAGLGLLNIFRGSFVHQSRSNGSRSSSPRAADTNGHSHPADAHKQQPSQQDHPTSKWTWAGYLLLVVITKYTMPTELRTSNPTVQHVWFYGWVTALSTGAGAAPLILAHDMGKAMLAFGNAVAAGMMLSASYSLVAEGMTVVEPAGFTNGWWGGFAVLLAAPWARMLLGVLAGLVFILSTKKVRVLISMDVKVDFDYAE